MVGAPAAVSGYESSADTVVQSPHGNGAGGARVGSSGPKSSSGVTNSDGQQMAPGTVLTGATTAGGVVVDPAGALAQSCSSQRDSGRRCVRSVLRHLVANRPCVGMGADAGRDAGRFPRTDAGGISRLRDIYPDSRRGRSDSGGADDGAVHAIPGGLPEKMGGLCFAGAGRRCAGGRAGRAAAGGAGDDWLCGDLGLLICAGRFGGGDDGCSCFQPGGLLGLGSGLVQLAVAADFVVRRGHSGDYRIGILARNR